MKSVENVLKYIVPDAKFFGSLVGNNEQAYSEIEWADDRKKPTWAELIAAAGDYEKAQAEKSIVAKTKQLAATVILAIAPEHKQRNMTARALEISQETEPTADEQAELDAIKAVWAKVKAVRAKSNELEAQYVEAGKELTSEDVAEIKSELENSGE